MKVAIGNKVSLRVMGLGHSKKREVIPKMTLRFFSYLSTSQPLYIVIKDSTLKTHYKQETQCVEVPS